MWSHENMLQSFEHYPCRMPRISTHENSKFEVQTVCICQRFFSAEHVQELHILRSRRPTMGQDHVLKLFLVNVNKIKNPHNKWIEHRDLWALGLSMAVC